MDKNGQEWTRITTLHSSSLLALLFFYNVTKDNPIEINGYKFTESYFEVKTYVHKNSESNMDVVLRGHGKNNKPVVLFLECKFSEYLNTGSYDGIGNEYIGKYNDLHLFDAQFDKIKIEKVDATENTSETIKIQPKEKTKMYCAGIKQMISHYIGVSNYAKDGKDALAKHRSFKHREGERIILGELLFDFNDKKLDNGDKLKNYRRTYEQLASKLNEDCSKNAGNNVELLPSILTYQELLNSNQNFKIEENIKLFYKLNIFVPQKASTGTKTL